MDILPLSTLSYWVPDTLQRKLISAACVLCLILCLYPQLVAVKSRKIISKSRALPSQRYLFLCMEPDCVHHCKKWSIWEYTFIFISRMVNSTALRSLFSSVWEPLTVLVSFPCILMHRSVHEHIFIVVLEKYQPEKNGKATWTCGNLDVKHNSRSKYMSTFSF